MTFRKLLKRTARALLPARLFQRLQSVRSRNHQKQFLSRHGLLQQVEQYVGDYGTVVKAGPFAGLIYPLSAALSRWSIPSLLGTYEKELHPALAVVATRKYDCVIDIGSAEGYYAVGLARMLRIPVFAYDPEPHEREYATQMAQMNGVSRLIRLEGLFTVKDMERFSNKRALVICDCEGFEEVLFTEKTIPLTERWDLIIELHGNAHDTLPALPWKQKVTALELQPRGGLENEYRPSGSQSCLWCDTEGR